MHESISARLVLSGLLGAVLVGVAAAQVSSFGLLGAPVVLIQALWLYRLWTVAHEALRMPSRASWAVSCL